MQERFLHGIDLFNRREFFECHEVLEGIWTPERGPRRLFLQALIHLAVAFYHVEQGNRLGAERQLRKGLKKLAAYLPEWGGIETARLYRACAVIYEKTLEGRLPEDFPVISFSEPARSLASGSRSDRPL